MLRSVADIPLQLTPVLSLVLAHDLLLSKKGIALPAKHGLHATVSRHKARLASELTKARLRRGCTSLEALREHVNKGALSGRGSDSEYAHPRWIRINTLLTRLFQELETTFAGYAKVLDLSAITRPNTTDKLVYVDPNIPDLVAVPGKQDFSASAAYKEGRLIFQEKASCFPAYLLDPAAGQADVIDACAAPGNKTTHLAALLSSDSDSDAAHAPRRKIYACEKDAARSQTLAKMIKLAGADELVSIRAKQDFLKLNPDAPGFAGVEALLLDPSCSGSGIVGRDEARVAIHLPSRDSGKAETQARSKKRKRTQSQPPAVKLETDTAAEEEEEEAAPPTNANEHEGSALIARLTNLSSFQLRLLEHAMSFPAAKRITYSTCSIHREENEYVVVRALQSDVARKRGWRVLRRRDQVDGLKAWDSRGQLDAVRELSGGDEMNAEEVAGACIRCEKGGEGGTMGFFVVGLVRDDVIGELNGQRTGLIGISTINGHLGNDDEEDEEEWEGFGDDG